MSRTLLTLLLSALPLAAQEPQALGPEAYFASMWTISKGLPQGSINDLVQTRDGALWAATFGGLVRFDGIEFQVFDLENVPAMPSNRCTALAEDEQHGLWVGLQSGHLLHFRDGRALAVEAIPGVDRQPLALLFHPSGALWVQCLGGTLQRLASGSWTELVPEGHAGSYEGLCLSADQSVAAAVGDELVIFEADGRQRARWRAPARILALAPGEDSRPWVGLRDGLARLGPEKIERVQLSLPPGLAIHGILRGAVGDLWLGTDYGAVHISPPGSASPGALVASTESVPPVSVRALLRDREGSIWIGSDGVGLIRLRPQKLHSFGAPETRSGVNGLAEDGEGGCWIAQECKGLFHLPDGQWEPEPVELPEGPGGERCVESILRDEAGRVWVAQAGRMLRLDRHVSEEFRPVLEELALAGPLGPMVRAGDGQVWISTRAGRLLRLAPDDRVLEQQTAPGALHSLAAGPDGSLWIGGDGVLWRLRGGRFEAHGAESGLPRGVLRDLLVEPQGGVWVASYGGGLGYFEDGRAATLSRAQGLPDNALSAIRDDAQDRLWLLSNQGLIVAERKALKAVVEGRAASFVPVVLGPEAGMSESQYGAPSSMRDALGRLWFGTIAGPVCVDPGAFPFNKTPPKVQIERLRADDVGLPLSGSVEIPALTRRLELDYTAFALAAPERTRFRCELEGFDERRLETAERSVAYTALGPGTYTFLVEARNEDGVWSETPARLQFRVLPAWWQTWIFRAAALLAGAALLLFLHRRRVEVIRRRAQSLLDATEGRARAEERESRLREELAHAGRVATAGELASSLAHEVNQPLAAIVTNAQAGRRLLAREQPAQGEIDEILFDIAQQGQRASEVIRRLREFLRKHEAQRLPVDVNGVVRDTLPLVRREIEDHGVRTRLELAVDLPAVLADPVQLQQVLVNLVKNSCEALAGQSGPRFIEIHSRRYDGRVLMDVSDNGPGLAPEVSGRLFQPYVTTKAAGMGLGLAICRSIVEAHGGRLSAEPRAQGGVQFRIDLPAGPGGNA